jgi:cysteinyl-tRNA synthetase
MTIRFFILQSHYRSTLDFSNEALQAAEKALKRLWEAYTNLQSLTIPDNTEPADAALDNKVKEWVNQFTEFMDDDLSTAKVLANMFELAPVINSLKNKQIPENSLSSHTVQLLQQQMKLFIEDIFGLQNPSTEQNDLLQKVMQVLLNIRKQAKAKKDFVTSDTIRNELLAVGIQIKDEKDGSMSYTLL